MDPAGTPVILLQTVLACCLLPCGCSPLVRVFQRRLISLPDTSPVPPAASVLLAAWDVTLTTADGWNSSYKMCMQANPWWAAGYNLVAIPLAAGILA